MTGLARLDGWPVAVLANDPYHYAGGWTADASRKVERFVDLAETFRLPVVHLVDNPGFLIGTASEQAGTIRHGARALAAVYQATVPWCSVLLRKVYGVAGAAHQNASRFSYRFAWPSGEWGSLPLEGGIEAAYRAQLEAAEDPVALRAEIEARLVARPQPVQDRGGVHDRGDRRPPRHPPPPLRVREPRGSPPPSLRRQLSEAPPPLTILLLVRVEGVLASWPPKVAPKRGGEPAQRSRRKWESEPKAPRSSTSRFSSGSSDPQCSSNPASTTVRAASRSASRQHSTTTSGNTVRPGSRSGAGRSC